MKMLNSEFAYKSIITGEINKNQMLYYGKLGNHTHYGIIKLRDKRQSQWNSK